MLTEDERAMAVFDGAQLAHQMRDAIKRDESHFPTDEERLLWWASFICCLGGMCAASIGPGALEAIASMAKKTTTELLRSKAN